MRALLARLTPIPLGPAMWAETLALPALTLALAYWARPQDPFLVGEPFPWLWLAPVLLALRYGVLPGIVGIVLFGAAWNLLSGEGEQHFPAVYFLGGLMLTLICGEFAGMWRTRLRRMEDLNVYLDQRLENLSKRLHLARLSHDRLQQSLISRPQTLRDALLRLRELIEQSGAHTELPALEALLRFLSRFCQLEVAAVYPVEDARQVGTQPLATLGSMGELDRGDPLIVHALSTQTLSHVQSEELRASRSRYLVAAPLRSSSNRTHALLVIQDMPFFALQSENLQTLAVLISYYADSIEAAESASVVRAILSDCPTEFADEMFKLMLVQKNSGITSHVALLIVPRAQHTHDLFQQLAQQKRNLDLVWEIRGTGHDILATLMPLANKTAVDGYYLRISAWIEMHYGRAPADAGIVFRAVDLAEGASLLTVQELLRKYGG